MATQKELAKLAGVSAGTVSNVITGSTHVSERSRQKVLEAIQTLDYRPNLIARSLKTNRTNMLGIVIPEITVPFFPKLIRGAQFAARERGYFLIVLDSDADAALEFESISLLHSQRVDGILLVSGIGEWRTDQVSTLAKLGPPMVCLDRLPLGLHVDSVSVDGQSAAEMGVAHLVAMGHREISIITGPLSLVHERERLNGYRQALSKAGISIQNSLVLVSSFDRDAIASACRKGLLLPARRPSALFTTNGVVALEALRSIYALGLSTPDDLAFVTLDEIAAADFFQPSITTVVQPAFEMGYRAVEVLLDRIMHPDAKGVPQRINLPPTLVVRASSSRPYADSVTNVRNR